MPNFLHNFAWVEKLEWRFETNTIFPWGNHLKKFRMIAHATYFLPNMCGREIRVFWNRASWMISHWYLRLWKVWWRYQWLNLPSSLLSASVELGGTFCRADKFEVGDEL